MAAAALVLIVGCVPPSAALSTKTADSGPVVVDTARADTAADQDTAGQAEPALPLEVVFLGVGGLSLRHGDDLILTAPMFTNPGLIDVTLGEVISDPEVIEASLSPEDVEGAAAILVGHGHYDHLLDVPHVAAMAGEQATVYGNLSVRNLLAGELDAVAVNDPSMPWVDRRLVDEPDPCTGSPGGEDGGWIEVPDTRVRLRPLASNHPAQFLGVVHFANGCVDEPLKTPPTRAADWLEGATLSWLVDFLDEEGEIVHRVYYQDAPTDAPDGLVHADLLADHGIDLAILNVGSWDAVDDHPTDALDHLAPRYVIGSHWEDFFETQAAGIGPIPFHADPTGFDARVEAWVEDGEAAEATMNGELVQGRYWRPDWHTSFAFPAEE